MPEKPLTRWGYDAEETQQVVAATLSVAVVLGDLLDEVCIVGGLVPTLLIDYRREVSAEGGHCGTNDLDVGLTFAVLNDERYKEIAARLRGAGFRHDETAEGRAVIQRWTMERVDVTIDFLIAPTDDERGGALKHLESDFGAIVAPGLPLAFDERELIELAGVTLEGDRVSRAIPVCGPGAYVVLKALAFRGRGERKDAYDLNYVLGNWPPGVRDIARRMARLAETNPDTVAEALAHIRDDYETIDHVGPRSVARFLDSGDEDAAAADARGRADDLLRLRRTRCATSTRLTAGWRRRAPSARPPNVKKTGARQHSRQHRAVKSSLTGSHRVLRQAHKTP